MKCRHSKPKLVQNLLLVPEGGVKSTQNTIVAVSRSACLTVHPHRLCLTSHWHCYISFPTYSIPFRDGQPVVLWVTFPSYTPQKNTHGCCKSIINAAKSFSHWPGFDNSQAHFGSQQCADSTPSSLHMAIFWKLKKFNYIEMSCM